jgi:thiamine biosynthesis protein ThiS
MDVTVNGQTVTVHRESTIADVLATTQRTGPAIAVELNGDVVSRDSYAAIKLQPGDMLEVVTLVGGG